MTWPLLCGIAVGMLIGFEISEFIFAVKERRKNILVTSLAHSYLARDRNMRVEDAWAKATAAIWYSK